MISKTPHIIVVGAGIVGASLAYHLVRQNVRVTLIDSAPGPAYQVTEKSFAWITAAHNAPKVHFDFCRQAIADWHRLEKELAGALKITWSGAISWYNNMPNADALAKLNSLDYKIRLIDLQQIYQLEPNLKIAPDQAVFAENEGAIDPVLTTQLLVKAAQEAGAHILFDTEVLSLIINGSGVTGVVTNEGRLAADLTVLAAGAGTTALCQPLGLKLPVNESPAILMKFDTEQHFVNRIVSNPFMEIRMASGKLLLAAEDYIDESPENNPRKIAMRTLAAIKKHWQGTNQIKLTDVRVGKRPIPENGQPIIGKVPDVDGLYLSVIHPGVTLAALAGRLAADEIVRKQDHILLSSYRANQFN